MNAQPSWYNQEMVSQKGSVILTNWKNEREAARKNSISNATDSALIRSSDPAVLELFGFNKGKVSITPQTAQRLSSVGACLNLLGNSLSTLPCHHYTEDAQGVRTRVEDSKIWDLLNLSPISNWTSAKMYQWWVRCSELRGDAISIILRDKFGNPTGIQPWHPDHVRAKLTGNDLMYFFTTTDGSKPFALSSDDVLHMAGNGFDGEKSLSAVQYDAHHAIGLALAANQYSQKFLENGASPKHLFETEKEMKLPQIDEFRELYDTRYAGPQNAGRPMILTEGLKMHALSMSSVDAQLIETLKYSVIDIARAFGVPPVLIGAQETTSSWGTGIGEIKLGFVTFRLEPKANEWEQELNRKLVRNPKEFVEFNFKAFLRGDTKSENEAKRQERGGSQGPGWKTLNEVRRQDNLPPIPGGDVIYEPKGATNEQKTTPTD